MTKTLNRPPRSDRAISLRAVAKSYAGRAAVHPLDLDFRPGETVALLGPNGAGKSTTIAMMLGLVTPDSGDVRVSDQPPRQAVADGRIAAMLQDAGMMPGVRVAELVRLGARLYPHPLSTIQALELAGLTEERKRRVDRLSGGQAQRLRFALAIVANPEVLVLDEPTRALDVHGRAEFWSAMREFAATSRTVLFATHYLDEVDENAERVIVMAGGRVVADGTPADIRARTGVSVVRVTTAGGLAALGRIGGAISVETRGERVSIKTTDPDATVRAIVAGPRPWRDIEVSRQSLDESFLSLTANSNADHTSPNYISPNHINTEESR